MINFIIGIMNIIGFIMCTTLSKTSDSDVNTVFLILSGLNFIFAILNFAIAFISFTS